MISWWSLDLRVFFIINYLKLSVTEKGGIIAKDRCLFNMSHFRTYTFHILLMWLYWPEWRSQLCDRGGGAYPTESASLYIYVHVLYILEHGRREGQSSDDTCLEFLQDTYCSYVFRLSSVFYGLSSHVSCLGITANYPTACRVGFIFTSTGASVDISIRFSFPCVAGIVTVKHQSSFILLLANNVFLLRLEL